MKLNKPDVTNTQTELESYVTDLLTDSSQNSEANGYDSKVTPLRKTVLKKVEGLPVQSKNEPASKLKQEIAPVAPDNIDSRQKANQKASSDKDSTGSQHEVSESSPIAAKQDWREVEVEKQIQPVMEQDDGKLDLVAETEARTKGQSNLSTKNPNKIGTSIHSNPVNHVQTMNHQRKIAEEIKGYKESPHHQDEPDDPRLKSVEKLLSRIAIASAVTSQQTISEEIAIPKDSIQSLTSTESLVPELQIDIESSEAAESRQLVVEDESSLQESAVASFSQRENKPLQEVLGSVFQTLVFEVDNLPLAVPLVKLGGIVNLDQECITPLVGTPDWFMGLVPNERGNLMVVDTLKFIMPERNANAAAEYQYLIVLDNSRWALACHSVGDAKNLSPDDIRWSSRSSNRPWFAGMVVEYMSALVEVDELINMLANQVVD
ncbi:MAG: chemotaxis protein CheW [Kangiellaceae bacterium]|nr:chemotaxis protein CheW [Kangiellaceae bacterium]